MSDRELLRSLLGKVAIANARLTYQRYKEIYEGPRWTALAEKGAQTQRLLWASTGAKNPNYRDVLYVEELIGADTVNTMPPATLGAFRDHGRPRPSLEENLAEARDTMNRLEQVGVSMKAVTEQLLEEGIKLFADAFDKLLKAVAKKCKGGASSLSGRQSYRLPEPLAAVLTSTIQDWRANGKARRLWARDASLWTGSDEANWLGWLDVTKDQLAHIRHLSAIAEESKREGFSHALLLGMGGSTWFFANLPSWRACVGSISGSRSSRSNCRRSVVPAVRRQFFGSRRVITPC